MSCSFHLQILPPSKEFMDSIVWAVKEELLTEDEIVDLIGDNIIAHMQVVEDFPNAEKGGTKAQ